MKLLVGVILPKGYSPSTVEPALRYVTQVMTKFDRRTAVEPFLEECACSAQKTRSAAYTYANNRCGEYIKSRDLKREWNEAFFDRLQYVGLMPDPRCLHCGGEGLVEVFTNRFGRVDNWVIGGDHYGVWVERAKDIVNVPVTDNITSVSNVRLNKNLIFPLHYVSPDEEWVDIPERAVGQSYLMPYDDNFVVMVQANDYEG